MTESPDTPPILARVAADLREIRQLESALLDQAINAAADHEMPGGDALVALGPVANLEAWEHLVEAAEEASGSLDLEHEDESDVPPLQHLLFWSEDWRRDLGAELDRRPTLVSEAGFLARHLTWAWETEPRFDDFAADVRKARSRMENLLHEGLRPVKGAPCLQCGRDLVRRIDELRPCANCGPRGHAPHDRGGVRIGWWFCLNRDCPVFEVSEDDYRRNVGAQHLEHAKALTATDMERRFGVKPSVVRVWGSRGLVSKRGRNGDGITLYDVSDVEARLRHADTDEVA